MNQRQFISELYEIYNKHSLIYWVHQIFKMYFKIYPDMIII